MSSYTDHDNITLGCRRPDLRPIPNPHVPSGVGRSLINLKVYRRPENRDLYLGSSNLTRDPEDGRRTRGVSPFPSLRDVGRDMGQHIRLIGVNVSRTDMPEELGVGSCSSFFPSIVPSVTTYHHPRDRTRGRRVLGSESRRWLTTSLGSVWRPKTKSKPLESPDVVVREFWEGRTDKVRTRAGRGRVDSIFSRAIISISFYIGDPFVSPLPTSNPCR